MLATDIDTQVLAKARAGVYSEEQVARLSQERLKRFFTKSDGGYRVVKLLRDMCVFARHDLTRDPPFSRLDFVLCRNVLMYFTPAQMRRTIRRLHDALVPGGWLVVSPSEGTAQRFPEFTPVMRAGAFLYRKKGAAEAQSSAAQPALAPQPAPSPSFPTIRLASAPSLPQTPAQEPGSAERGALPRAIDFAARVPWWRERWRNELIPAAQVVVAEADDAMQGFVTIDATGYLDQIVVAPEQWGSPLAAALLDEAKRLSPTFVSLLVNKDNARAIRFYERNGFAHAGEDVNPTSGRAVLRMEWKR